MKTVVFKRRDFARWQSGQHLPDSALCTATREMEHGLIGADLGGRLYKKRLARPGRGKRAGYRALISAHIGHCCVFLHGFAKADQNTITPQEQKALQLAGQAFLTLTPSQRRLATDAGILSEIGCDEQTH